MDYPENSGTPSDHFQVYRGVQDNEVIGFLPPRNSELWRQAVIIPPWHCIRPWPDSPK